MAEPTKLFITSSLLMASLFAYSASVQLNDPDWYFWFPLYVLASVVNLLMSKTRYRSKTIRKLAKVDLWLGMFLFLKVVIEDYVNGLVGFWSLDLSGRVVREKMGSGLVLVSMVLHLVGSANNSNETRNGSKKVMVKVKAVSYVDYGMAMLVIVSYGIPLVFFVFLKGDLKI